MKFTLGKQERLKSKKLIDQLYKKGKSIKVFPFRMVYLQTEHTSSYPAQVGVSVAKRNFKKAPDRNRLKRLMRETYRLQKATVYENVSEPYIFMISYIGKEEKTYQELHAKMNSLLHLFIEKVNYTKNETL
ncbi:ribonuclease P protein component [Polaribacter sp. R77954]|uniref:ribonuclease P protein component n=1 Tax=Polaribacter sp. R77954 TaxID=3093870 RepID=UPI0037C92E63